MHAVEERIESVIEVGSHVDVPVDWIAGNRSQLGPVDVATDTDSHEVNVVTPGSHRLRPRVTWFVRVTAREDDAHVGNVASIACVQPHGTE